MKITITARISASNHRKWVFGNEGNNAIITWGMVSPTMMQNATMPPKALKCINDEIIGFRDSETHNAHWAIEMATSPDLP